jgi:hypothetical protein
MSEELALSFAEIAGCSVEQAQFYLEMTGGDFDLSLTSYFAAGDESGGVQPPHSANPSALDDESSAISQIVFAAGEPIHEAWRLQSLRFNCLDPNFSTAGAGHWDQLNIYQPKNGPCGVLAAFIGTAIALLAKKGSLLPGAAISLQDVSSTIALILSQCTTATRESFKFVYGTNQKIVADL